MRIIMICRFDGHPAKDAGLNPLIPTTTELPALPPQALAASDDELQSECNRICKNMGADYHQKDQVEVIGMRLAIYLIQQNNINFIWRFSGCFEGKSSLVDYLSYLDPTTVVDLIRRGLDLNPITHSGIATLTWMIGNAENGFVDVLLMTAESLQTPAQRAAWINRKDAMLRIQAPTSSWSCCGLFSPQVRVTPVQQTLLQLTIAKGYRVVDGSGRRVRVSNLVLASRLLKLGAVDEIDYQEPAKGNSALHMACARRDADAVMLLLYAGASAELRNHDDKRPMDMINLNFKEAYRLMAFHTSPDGHPGTFHLQEFRTLVRNTSPVGFLGERAVALP